MGQFKNMQYVQIRFRRVPVHRRSCRKKPKGKPSAAVERTTAEKLSFEDNLLDPMTPQEFAQRFI